MAYKRYTQLPVLLDILSTGTLTVLDPSSWQDQNDTYFLERYARHKKIPGVLALCLTQAGATFHHWQIYAGGGISAVRIKFKEKPFREWAASHGSDVQLRDVQYFHVEERDKIAVPDGLPFAKRHAFRDEGEVRLVVRKKDASERARRMPLPLSLIDKITLSPWLPPALFESVKQAVHRAAGDDQLKVRATTMLANERFKEIAAADLDEEG